MGIYERKTLREKVGKHTKCKNQGKRNKTRTCPRKQERNQDLDKEIKRKHDQEKRKF